MSDKKYVIKLSLQQFIHFTQRLFPCSYLEVKVDAFTTMQNKGKSHCCVCTYSEKFVMAVKVERSMQAGCGHRILVAELLQKQSDGDVPRRQKDKKGDNLIRSKTK
jgi:hypothetical protein